MILMALGPFRFSVSTYSIEELERRAIYRWHGQDVVGARPVQHWLGPGEETVLLHSTFYPFGGLNGGGRGQLDGLRQAAFDGRVMMLVSGSGRVYGRWSVREAQEMNNHFLANGEAQKIEVQMTLVAHDNQEGEGGRLPSLFG